MSEASAPNVAVDVCLVTWNGAQVLDGCLESLSRQTLQSFRLFILDNGSTDETIPIIERWVSTRTSVEVEKSEKNLGFAYANNQLIRKGNAPFVFVLNQDTDLAPDYLERLVQVLEQHDKAASVSGLLLRMNVSPQGLGRTHLVDAAGLRLYPTHRVVEIDRGAYHQSDRQQLQEVFGVPATAALYRRAALEAAALPGAHGNQYFDESFVSYKEDVDLAYRLVLAGWTSYCVEGAVAYHVRGLRGDEVTGAYGNVETLRKRSTKRPEQNMLSYRNHLMFLKGDVLFTPANAIWWRTFIYELGKFFVILLTEPHTLVAWRDVVQQWPVLRRKRALIKSRNPHRDVIEHWMYVSIA